MLNRYMDDILWKLLNSYIRFRLYMKYWQIPFTEKKMCERLMLKGWVDELGKDVLPLGKSGTSFPSTLPCQHD